MSSILIEISVILLYYSLCLLQNSQTWNGNHNFQELYQNHAHPKCKVVSWDPGTEQGK